VLGELDDDAGEVRAAGQGGLHHRGAQQVRADVDGQEGVRRQRRDGGERLGDRQRLELGGHAGLGGRGEPDVRAAGAGEPDQRLVAGHRRARQVDDRLEDQPQVVGVGEQRTTVRQRRPRPEHAGVIGPGHRPLEPGR
jgi:hypothetical protein